MKYPPVWLQKRIVKIKQSISHRTGTGRKAKTILRLGMVVFLAVSLGVGVRLVKVVQDLRTKAAGVAFPIRVEPKSGNYGYSNPGSSWKLIYTGTNPAQSQMNTALQLEAWNCHLYDLRECSGHQTISPWKEPNGTIKLMKSGSLTNYPPANISERIYFSMYKPTQSIYSTQFNYSSTSSNTVSAFASGVTDSQVKSKYNQAINAYRTKYPLETQAGLWDRSNRFNTIQGVKTSSLSDDAKLDYIGRIRCGESPIYEYQASWDPNQVKQWLEKFAKWRTCLAHSYNTLNLVTLYDYKQAKIPVAQAKKDITAYVYSLMIQLDILLTKSTDNRNDPAPVDMPKPFAGFINPSIPNNKSYVLGDTDFAKEYISDFGMGVLRGTGMSKYDNLVERYYCSEYEAGTQSQEAPPGPSCPAGTKRIDLYDRIRKITRKLYEKEYTEGWFTSRSGEYNASRHVTGASEAVKINSTFTSAEKLTIFNTAAQIASVNYTKSNPLIFDYARIPSDYYQHYLNIFTIYDWVVVDNSSPFGKNNQAYPILKIFRDSYWTNDKPIFFTDTDAYNEDVVNDIPSDASRIADCNSTVTNYVWNRNTAKNGKLSGLRGEPPTSAILTSIPAVKHIAESANPYILPEVRGLTDKMLNILVANPPDPNSEKCHPQSAGEAIQNSNLHIVARQLTWLMSGYFGWIKQKVGAF